MKPPREAGDDSRAPTATSGQPRCPSRPAPVYRPAQPPREAEEVRPEEPKKKRGFWSRVFGIDKKDDKKKDEKKKPGGG